MVQILYQKELIENLPSGFLGINIGPNKDTKIKRMIIIFVYQNFSNAGYITINISSPNTEGLERFSRSKRELKNYF